MSGALASIDEHSAATHICCPLLILGKEAFCLENV
jgi:hypothetical protein